MLRAVSKHRIEDVVEENTEPFVDEAGTGLVTLDNPALELTAELGPGDYIIDDEYGRIWSRDFFNRHKQLYAGPPLLEQFSNYGFLSVPFRRIPRRRVETREELYRALAALHSFAKQRYPNRVIVFRGQTREYPTARPGGERERLFGSVDAIEPSLHPSGTRRPPLSDTAQAVWSLLVQRHLSAVSEYDPAHRFVDTGRAWPFATHLGPIVALAFAQHYGLPTPALDVTTDIGVALWFALNTLTGTEGGSTVAAGAENGEGVVYCIAGSAGEFFGEDLENLIALRPHRQRGGFLASNWGNSKNRAARAIVGAVYFAHSIAAQILSELPTAEYLFPGPREDAFVSLLQEIAWYQRHGSEALAAIARHIYWVEDRRTSGVAPELAGLDRAARHGDPDAMATLGLLLSKRGDPAGEQWTRRAAEAGQPDAMNNLGLIHSKRGEEAEAERWLDRAARSGLTAAAYNLGLLLNRNGRISEAEHWFAVAAEAGDPDAACNLGKMYFHRGDLESAEKWFRLGAEAGQAQAAHNLGQLCASDGRNEEAIHWFGISSELGDPDARYYLERLRKSE